MTQEFPMNIGDGGHEQTIHDVSVVSSQNVTFNQTQIIQISVEEVKTRRFIITSPYKGLKKFELEDKDRFFGRDQFLTGLVNELEQTNLVLLLGASGSGKSSVIRSGLIPWLAEKQGSHLINLVFTPDQDPFESLYASLLGKYKQSEAQIARISKEDTLTHLVRSLKQADDYWFILIDQFEELFTTTESNKRDVFIKSLVKFVKELDQSGDRSVKLVATMRADFLDRLSPYPNLIKVTDHHRPMIAEMQLDELRLAIEQPAAHHGVVFESGLVKQIIDDVQGQAGYLPLLQYTLNLLWETEVQSQSIEDRTLNISNYRKLGGVRGALQQHVEQIYKSLSESEKLAAQRIFLKLVGIGEDEGSGNDWKPVRRRANRSEFSDPLEQTVLTQLVNQNLLVSNRVTDSQESTVEIAHEALLTSWTTLNIWINENRQAIALRNRLNDDVEQWKKTKSHEDLWSGSRLEQILELRQNETFNQVLGGLSQKANQFLDASQGERDRIQKEKLRGIQFTAIGAIIVAILLGSLWWRTEQLRQESALREDIATVKNLLTTNPTKGLILAIRSIGMSQSKFPDMLGSAESSLFSALDASRETNILQGHQGAITAVAVSKENLIASASIDGTICLWKQQPNNQLTCQPLKKHQGAVLSIAFSHDSKTLVSGGADGKILLWNIEDKTSSLLGSFKKSVRVVTFNPVQSNIFYSGGDDGILRQWDISFSQKDSQTIGIRPGRITAVSVNPDGKIIAVGGDGYILRLWNLEKPNSQPQKLSLLGDSQDINAYYSDGSQVVGGITSVVFASDSWQKYIIASSKIGNEPHRETIRIFNLESPISSSNPTSIKAHEFSTYSVAFDFKNNQIISGGDDGKISFYQLTGEVTRSALLGHGKGYNNIESTKILGYKYQTNREINAIALSSDNRMIVSGGSDGTIRIWDSEAFPGITKAQVIENIRGYQSNPKLFVNLYEEFKIPIRVIQHEKGWFEIISKGNSLQLQEISDPKVTPKLNIENSRLFFSDDGKYIATLNQNHQIQIFNDQGKSIESPFIFDGEVKQIAISPRSQRMVIVNTHDELDVRDFKGNRINRPFVHEDIVKSIAISPDGQRLVTASSQGMPQGGGDSIIRLWDIQGHLLLRLKQNKALFQNSFGGFLKFSSSGRSIVSYDYVKSLSFQVLPGSGQTALDIACHRLANHPMLNDPNTLAQDEIARSARETCQKYSPDWQTR